MEVKAYPDLYLGRKPAKKVSASVVQKVIISIVTSFSFGFSRLNPSNNQWGHNLCVLVLHK